MKALKAFFHKTFWGTTKKCKNKNLKLIFILMYLSKMHEAERVKHGFCKEDNPIFENLAQKIKIV